MPHDSGIPSFFMLTFEQYPPGCKSLVKDKFANAAMTLMSVAAPVRVLDDVGAAKDSDLPNRHHI